MHVERQIFPGSDLLGNTLRLCAKVSLRIRQINFYPNCASFGYWNGVDREACKPGWCQSYMQNFTFFFFLFILILSFYCSGQKNCDIVFRLNERSTQMLYAVLLVFEVFHPTYILCIHFGTCAGVPAMVIDFVQTIHTIARNKF